MKERVWTFEDVRWRRVRIGKAIQCIWVCRLMELPPDLTRYITEKFVMPMESATVHDNSYSSFETAQDMIEAQVYNMPNELTDPLSSSSVYFMSIVFLLICMACTQALFGTLNILFPTLSQVWMVLSFVFTFAGPHLLLTKPVYKVTVARLRTLLLHWFRRRR